MIFENNATNLAFDPNIFCVDKTFSSYQVATAFQELL
jgi:hypothetical protein